MNRIIEGITILLNTATNCTFIASALDEKVQTGTRENDRHIEWAGELDIQVIVPTLCNKCNSRTSGRNVSYCDNCIAEDYEHKAFLLWEDTKSNIKVEVLKNRLLKKYPDGKF